MKLRGIKKPPNFYRLLHLGKAFERTTNAETNRKPSSKKVLRKKIPSKKVSSKKVSNKISSRSVKKKPAGRILKKTRDKVHYFYRP